MTLGFGRVPPSILPTYPDFGDGLLDAFVVDLPEGDGVKLALVQVGHGPVSGLLAQTLGCLQSVLEVVPTKSRPGVS